MQDHTCDPAKQRQIKLGNAIRAARLPMSQVELAKRLDYPQSSISNWENGKVMLSAEQIHWLEEALDLTAGQLLLDAGYIDPALIPMRLHSGNRPIRPPARWSCPSGASSFPDRVRAWLDDFGPLVDTICLLRESAADDTALNALLDSRPVVMLRLGWELWEAISPEAGADPDATMAATIGEENLQKCWFALWDIVRLSESDARRLHLAQ